jgi:hypothetical protein
MDACPRGAMACFVPPETKRTSPNACSSRWPLVGPNWRPSLQRGPSWSDRTDVPAGDECVFGPLALVRPNWRRVRTRVRPWANCCLSPRGSSSLVGPNWRPSLQRGLSWSDRTDVCPRGGRMRVRTAVLWSDRTEVRACREAYSCQTELTFVPAGDECVFGPLALVRPN